MKTAIAIVILIMLYALDYKARRIVRITNEWEVKRDFSE